MLSVELKDPHNRTNRLINSFAKINAVLWDPNSGSGGVPELKGARSFTYEQLQKYTNNFSETNNIGRGGYGMVYKGSLSNGQLIAIKRAQGGSSQGGFEFKTEIELLSRIHHKNVVGLIGFCFDQSEQMLVYEYIVNGTLKDSLSGLQYLHDHADPPIIHRDVKTNNILLNERLVAKVADFGLSKPLSDADRTYVTTQVKGTMGYMDPEYYMTQQLTEKSDTYSFGVVMLELITARNPIEKGKYIVRKVKEAMNKNKELYDLQEVLDPTIGLSSQLKGFERFVDLALRCVEDMGYQRPTMSEVVKELESIIELMVCTESSSSTSASYEGASIDHNYPYSNDSLLSYNGGSLPPTFHPK
uniref:Putative concanavalin A-like lectin/glucanase domain, Telokin/Myosin light chain kinase n=1 Tax=Helianthus annuus TaxID=4232 RepID=A0A251T3X8_HELAN